jgi:hypothetical protein
MLPARKRWLVRRCPEGSRCRTERPWSSRHAPPDTAQDRAGRHDRRRPAPGPRPAAIRRRRRPRRRRLGWGLEMEPPPSPVSVTLDTEAFTAMAAVSTGNATRRILERALQAADKLGDEPPGRVMGRPRAESVACWGGFALAETPDGTELAEAERLLSWNLSQAQRDRNLMAVTETQSALALVLARRGDVGAARVHVVAAHEGAVRLRSRRSAERVRRARALLPVSPRAHRTCRSAGFLTMALFISAGIRHAAARARPCPRGRRPSARGQVARTGGRPRRRGASRPPCARGFPAWPAGGRRG